jgi:hypothetical protein
MIGSVRGGAHLVFSGQAGPQKPTSGPVTVSDESEVDDFYIVSMSNRNRAR